MFCPYCESERSGERAEGVSEAMTICPNCGVEVPVEEHTSATQCPSCDSYLIFNQRVEGKYAPELMIPFKLGKETCKKSIREKFRKCIFAPVDFLSEVRLDSMQGVYVPFWFYDYDTDCCYEGEGTRVKTWRSGNMQYTETSYYAIRRDMDIDFQKIPVDASEQMPDDVMNLMEPFQYSQLENFAPEYISGFYAEKYNMDSEAVENRARAKMDEDAGKMLRDSVSGYSSVKTLRQDVRVKNSRTRYGLLPIWRYVYTYNNKEYPFYVNGQTGKIVGTAPVSPGRVWLYAGTLWACLTAILIMVPLLVSWL